MMKKKAKGKTSKKPAKKTAKKKSTVKVKGDTNPAEVRKELSKMVEAEASAMAKAVIDEAKKGRLPQAKYMFEVASIFPAVPNGEQATKEEDCLAKILLAKIDGPPKSEEEKLEETTESQSPQAFCAKSAETKVGQEVTEEVGVGEKV